MTVRYIQGKSKSNGGGGSFPSKQSSRYGSEVESHTEFSVLAPDDAASIVSQLENPRSFLRGGSDDDKIKMVEELFHKGAGIGVSMWLFLMIVVYLIAPNASYEQPSGFEQLCHIVGGTLLIVSNGARLLPLFLKDKGFKILKSGFIVGSLAVQLVALASNYIMAFRPTPVLFDEISGLRFHLVRWAEWIPLAFLMAFLTINVDAPFKGAVPSVDFVFPAMMALSTSAGLLFPFCPDEYTWWGVMGTSWSLFSMIYVVTYQRGVEYLELKGEVKASSKSKANAQQAERLDLTKSSFSLCLAISVTWTLLALMFTFLGVVTKLARKDSWISNPAIPVALTCTFEVMSKVWYLGALFEAYGKVFDDQVRGHRRLEELRSFMSAVWASSSDVIVFCSKHNDLVTARISPSFLTILGSAADTLEIDLSNEASLVLEIDQSQDLFSVVAVDLDRPVSRSDLSSESLDMNARSYRISKADDVHAPEVNLARMAKLALDAVTLAPALLERINPSKFVASCGKGGKGMSEMSCEVNISLLEGRSCVLTLRDISERLHRFQIDKKLVKEVTSRKKDEEANRFTRHEVKNALLAAMGILDHLKELMQRSNVLPKRNTDEKSMFLLSDNAPMVFMDMGGDDETTSPQTKEVEEAFNELDTTLKDVLDTILDEAMAREIIYGDYTPRKERMNVPDVLDSLRRRASRRFPMEITPTGSLFPVLEMDRQLLRYIYRNAVSNACKYGKKEGIVSTRVTYDRHLQLLTMQVINLPGIGHEKLCQLSASEAAKVFEQDTQLKATQEGTGREHESIRNESSGNGAWIMKKCAEAMDGKVDIKFEKTRTVFTFSCAASPVYMPERSVRVNNLTPSMSTEEFAIPPGTWGVIIDDSRIQRKVLGTFMQLIGIDKSRQVILGATKEEIHGFGDSVQKLLKSNPHDKFLLIVDENLDIVDGGTRHETVSGSIATQNLLAQLDNSAKSRVLALIRSANDSDMDIQVYRKRAHGHLRKEPLKKTGNLELIKPWWIERFSASTEADNLDDSSANNTLDFAVADDVRESLGVINALSAVASDARWQPIREKLHALKGDLKATMPLSTIGRVVSQIDQLMSTDRLPRDFSSRWVRLQSEIETILSI